MSRFAVLGAGNGGQAMATHLAARGMDVILFNRRIERLEPLLAAGTLRVTGAVEATVPVTLHGTRAGVRASTRCGVVWVTDRVEEAAKADVLMVTVPATAHAELGRVLAPHVREGQVIVLNPGRTLGALEMEMALQGRNMHDGYGPTVAEAQSLLYAARVVGPAHVHVFSIKRRVALAALPARRTRVVLDRIRGVFPQFRAAPSVLHTSLDNIGAIFHPAPVLLNLARVEAGESFDHYHQGMTPAVVRVLEAADEERLAVARALGVEIPSAHEWLSLAYRAAGEDLYRALQGNTAYTGIKAPSDLNTRYLWEDVPTGLVPLASLGEAVGVPTPTMNSLIHLASLVHGIDYLRHGRTLRNMGLSGVSGTGLDSLCAYVLEERGRGGMTHNSSRAKLLLATLGDCVHVAGVFNFMRLAEEQGYRCHFAGHGLSPEQVVEAIRQHQPQLVGLSYRLTPEAAGRLLDDLKRLLATFSGQGIGGHSVREHSSCQDLPRLVFGGTPPVAEVARKAGLFERVFDGSEGDEGVIAYLRGEGTGEKKRHYPSTLPERIAHQAPYPIIRHHFGLPSLTETIAGVRQLAEARVLDVISIGPDQNAQESFFRPGEMDPRQDGAGGVPVRQPEDFAAIYAASRCGNHPLVRSYSGTRDLIPMARLLKQTVNLAWGAVPLLWYNVLDGRSSRPLGESVREAQETMRWHARHGIPLEVNEAHHWSLRDAPDVVAVAAAFLAAYSAKKAGISHYVAQYMFNTPPGTTFPMDLGKMLAKVELVEALADRNFTVYRQTRTGLASLPVDMALAKGQLASSTMLQMALRPQIVHVVAHCEAHHAATPADIIESVGIARGVIRNALHGLPDMASDPRVQERKEELVEEATLLLDAIRQIAPPGTRDPWTDPATLVLAVRIGLLDAPHLRGNPAARGQVRTRIVDGACRAVDEEGRPLPERVRIARLLAGAHRAAG